ncbi:undecaprenyl-diphosphatase [Peribacillus deserti]|uniref:Undecaprenyl-diphosphatase n=1 Tax=Peribacillus deserti TaxID=673318 RepID=A0ABS2QH49_9BACI|nr:phosphatase PAP2 family protein [Peribacillus deserti]MBM7692496.1 undecaprenyl-diphosphatase [Peribacillus deserti]
MNEQKKSILTISQILYILFAAIMIIGCSAIFIAISKELNRNELIWFDQQFIDMIQGMISNEATVIMKFFTFGGSVLFISIGVLILFILLICLKKPRYALYLILSSGLGGLFNYFLKWLFKRERPSILPLIQEHGFSFPSGHSMGSFIFYGSLAVIVAKLSHRKAMNWAAGISFAIVILLIGISRIYLGVHYPSDVIAGFAAGGVWLTVCGVGLNYYEFRQKVIHNKIAVLRQK